MMAAATAWEGGLAPSEELPVPPAAQPCRGAGTKSTLLHDSAPPRTASNTDSDDSANASSTPTLHPDPEDSPAHSPDSTTPTGTALAVTTPSDSPAAAGEGARITIDEEKKIALSQLQELEVAIKVRRVTKVDGRKVRWIEYRARKQQQEEEDQASPGAHKRSRRSKSRSRSRGGGENSENDANAVNNATNNNNNNNNKKSEDIKEEMAAATATSPLSVVGTSNVLESMKQQFMQATENIESPVTNGTPHILAKPTTVPSTTQKRKSGRTRKSGAAPSESTTPNATPTASTTPPTTTPKTPTTATVDSVDVKPGLRSGDIQKPPAAVPSTTPLAAVGGAGAGAGTGAGASDSLPHTPTTPLASDLPLGITYNKNYFNPRSLTKGLREVRKLENGTEGVVTPKAEEAQIPASPPASLPLTSLSPNTPPKDSSILLDHSPEATTLGDVKPAVNDVVVDIAQTPAETVKSVDSRKRTVRGTESGTAGKDSPKGTPEGKPPKNKKTPASAKASVSLVKTAAKLVTPLGRSKSSDPAGRGRKSGGGQQKVVGSDSNSTKKQPSKRRSESEPRHSVVNGYMEALQNGPPEEAASPMQADTPPTPEEAVQTPQTPSGDTPPVRRRGRPPKKKPNVEASGAVAVGKSGKKVATVVVDVHNTMNGEPQTVIPVNRPMLRGKRTSPNKKPSIAQAASPNQVIDISEQNASKEPHALKRLRTSGEAWLPRRGENNNDIDIRKAKIKKEVVEEDLKVDNKKSSASLLNQIPVVALERTQSTKAMKGVHKLPVPLEVPPTSKSVGTTSSPVATNLPVDVKNTPSPKTPKKRGRPPLNKNKLGVKSVAGRDDSPKKTNKDKKYISLQRGKIVPRAKTPDDQSDVRIIEKVESPTEEKLEMQQLPDTTSTKEEEVVVLKEDVQEAPQQTATVTTAPQDSESCANVSDSNVVASTAVVAPSVDEPSPTPSVSVVVQDGMAATHKLTDVQNNNNPPSVVTSPQKAAEGREEVLQEGVETVVMQDEVQEITAVNTSHDVSCSLAQQESAEVDIIVPYKDVCEHAASTEYGRQTPETQEVIDIKDSPDVAVYKNIATENSITETPIPNSDLQATQQEIEVTAAASKEHANSLTALAGRGVEVKEISPPKSRETRPSPLCNSEGEGVQESPSSGDVLVIKEVPGTDVEIVEEGSSEVRVTESREVEQGSSSVASVDQEQSQKEVEVSNACTPEDHASSQEQVERNKSSSLEKYQTPLYVETDTGAVSGSTSQKDVSSSSPNIEITKATKPSQEVQILNSSGSTNSEEVQEIKVPQAKSKEKVPRILKQLFQDEGVQNMLKSMGEDCINPPETSPNSDAGAPHKLRPKRATEPMLSSSPELDAMEALLMANTRKKKRGTELDTLYMDEGVLNLLTSLEPHSRRPHQDDASSDTSSHKSFKAARTSKGSADLTADSRKRKLSGASTTSTTSSKSMQPPDAKKMRVEGGQGLSDDPYEVDAAEEFQEQPPKLIPRSSDQCLEYENTLKKKGKSMLPLGVKQKNKAIRMQLKIHKQKQYHKEMPHLEPEVRIEDLSKSKMLQYAIPSRAALPDLNKSVPPLKIRLASDSVTIKPIARASPSVQQTLDEHVRPTPRPSARPSVDEIISRLPLSKPSAMTPEQPRQVVSTTTPRPVYPAERPVQCLSQQPVPQRRAESLPTTPATSGYSPLVRLEGSSGTQSVPPKSRQVRMGGELRQSQRASVRQSEANHHYRDISLRKFNNFTQIILSPSTTKMKNSLNSRVLRELCEALALLKRDETVRMVLLTGTGSTFCQGVDLTALQHPNLDTRKKNAENLVRGIKDFLKTLVQFPKPIVAGVNGSAMGLGVTMLPLFDMVIASDKAEFYLPYAKLGQVPEGGATYTFPNLFGKLQSTRLFLGHKLTACKAQELGLASESIWPATYQQELIPKVALLATQSSQSMEATKALMNHHLVTKLELSLESECRLLLQHWTSPHFSNLCKRFLDTHHVQFQKPVNLPL